MKHRVEELKGLSAVIEAPFLRGVSSAMQPVALDCDAR
ncbi:hypothetical protein AWB69_02087 [Caballeronia udeis]|uniref:Uncharacterized protein n=1 Tax=Caballeronia udeis TaxID=1232866 RepID=A0A158G5Z0_9BURK|nr:hypothetical protein AWB69_02087 [Caballeronia udeis]